MVVVRLPRSRELRGLFLSLQCVLVSFSATAQITCGDPPKDVPIATQEQLKGDAEGKAQLFTKLLGTAQIKGAVDANRTELYQEHKNLDQHQVDMYFLWVSCQTIASDKTLATAEKLKLWEEVRASFSSTKDAPAATPPPVNITGGDNVVSVGQIGGITAREVTVINPPTVPELRILSREDINNPDGSHTVILRTQVASPITPGLLIIQIQADGMIKDVHILPPAVGGVSTINLRNVRRGSNYYYAEIPSPRGEYDIAITTAQRSNISLAASF